MPSRADLVPLVLVATAWIDLVTAIDNGIGVVPPKGWRRCAVPAIKPASSALTSPTTSCGSCCGSLAGQAAQAPHLLT
jgi:hypothetical protein